MKDLDISILNREDLKQKLQGGEISLDRFVEFHFDRMFVKDFAHSINDHDIGTQGRLSRILDVLSHKFNANKAFIYFEGEDLQDSRNMTEEDLYSRVNSSANQDILEGYEDENLTSSRKHGVRRAAFALDIQSGEGDKRGILYLGSKTDKSQYTDSEIDMIRSELINLISNSISSSYNSGERDDLTGLYRRKPFEKIFRKTLANTLGAENRELSMIMIDLDHFKLMNDTYSHKAGDQVLIEVAKILQDKEIIRKEGDVAARYGGEEMLIMLPNTSLKDSLDIARRVKKAIGDISLPYFYDHVLIADSEGNRLDTKQFNEYKGNKKPLEELNIKRLSIEEYLSVERSELVKISISHEDFQERIKELKSDYIESATDFESIDNPVGQERITASMGIGSYPSLTKELVREYNLESYIANSTKAKEIFDEFGKSVVLNYALIDYVFQKDPHLIVEYENEKRTIHPDFKTKPCFEMEGEDQLDFLAFALFQYADRNMYTSKHTGRNRITV